MSVSRSYLIDIAIFLMVLAILLPGMGSAQTSVGNTLKDIIENTTPNMTTNQGYPITDDDNSQTVGERGPTLLQDFQFIEKIAHFDRERIPERVVHAKGAGAFGYFQVYEPMANYTRAKFLQDPSKKTPVFVTLLHRGRRPGICGHGAGRAGIRGQVLHRGGQLRYSGQRHPRLLHQGCHEVPGSGPCREGRAQQQHPIIVYGA